MDIKNPLIFAHPLGLLDVIKDKLSILGAEKFMKGAGKEPEKAREALAGFFFIMGLSKYTGKTWWLAQPEVAFPDFNLMAFGDTPESLETTEFELVQVPIHFKTYEEARGNVFNKINKGYSGAKNLVIFFNHPKAGEWIHKLNSGIKDYKPFESIWSVHLLSEKPDNVQSSVITRIRPYPPLRTTASMSEPLPKTEALPSFMEKTEVGGKNLLKFNDSYINDLRKKAMIKRRAN